jgi:phosphoadenosine phosphosulfate reductase
MTFDPELADVRAELGALEPFPFLRAALARFGDGLVIASSFGAEDMLVLHEAARAGREIGIAPRVFLLDTGRLHQETYDLVDRVREKYDVRLEVYAPNTVSVEALVRKSGPNGFYRSVEDRQECCAVRKVEPLARALEAAAAWVTGMRRVQSTTRTAIEAVERDPAHGGLFKLNPLAAMTDDDLWREVRELSIPIHTLHAQGYPSIGCAPCTRAIAPGEDVRAGRWWWESPEHKECGLHNRPPSAAGRRVLANPDAKNQKARAQEEEAGQR